MLIEVKTKVSRIIDAKTKKKAETYILDKELFAEAEYAVMNSLTQEQDASTVEDFEILSLKQSTVKEIVESTMAGAFPFIVTLRDIFHDDNGNEKYLRYKVLLWANDLSQANVSANELASQGYDMLVEGIKQVDYIYLTEEPEEEASDD